MWYHSALSLMLVEITARSFAQMSAQILLYIINAIFNAILFGFLFDLLEEARRSEHAFQSEIDNANTAMSNLHLPDHLQEAVRQYINYMHPSKVQ